MPKACVDMKRTGRRVETMPPRIADQPIGKLRKQFFVYIMASKLHGVLYLGVTSDLPHRVYEHRESLIEGFTKRYLVRRLVYYEPHDSAVSAIAREKVLKKWRRAQKDKLIEEKNLSWDDLWSEIAIG